MRWAKARRFQMVKQLMGQQQITRHLLRATLQDYRIETSGETHDAYPVQSHGVSPRIVLGIDLAACHQVLALVILHPYAQFHRE